MRTQPMKPAGSRPPLCAIAWAPSGGRARELAAVFGGESRSFFDLGIVQRPLVPLRYLVSAVRTGAYLAWRRPRALIVQAPPLPAAAIAGVYGRLARAPVVLDTHPSAFGLPNDPVNRLMRPFVARLARRAAGCIVTTQELGDAVEAWGGRPLVVHEGPPTWASSPLPAPEPGAVLFVSTFAPDEPLAEVLEAARRQPHVRFRITGDLRRLPRRVRAGAPANVEWPGYLHGDDYAAALGRADAVLSLSTRRQSVPRSAYEAVYAGRPLIAADWPHMEELFPYAAFTAIEPDSISRTVSRVIEERERFHALAPDARRVQEARWREQAESLRRAIAANGLRTGGGKR